MTTYKTSDGFIAESTPIHDGIVVFTTENPFVNLKAKEKAAKIFDWIQSKEILTLAKTMELVAEAIAHYGFWHTKNIQREIDMLSKSIFEVSKGKFDDASKLRVSKAIQTHLEKMENMNQYE
jgi:hypothetical protein